MDSLLTRSLILDRLPLSMAGIVAISDINGIGASKFNGNNCK